MVPHGPCTTRRSLLAAVGAAGLGTLAGCRSLLAPEQQRWAVEFDHHIPYDPLLVGSDVLLAGLDTESRAGHMYAIDAENGDRRWRADVPATTAAPAVRENLVVAGTETGLVGLGRETGEERWRADTGERVSTVTTTGDGVYANADGILALDGAGEVRWSVDAPVLGPLAAGTLAVVTTVRAGDHEETLVAHDPADGTERWRASVGTGRFPAARVAVDGDRVYAVGERVTVLDATTGAVRWSFDPGQRESLSTPPVMAEGLHIGSGVRFAERDYGTVFSLFEGEMGYEFRTDETVRGLTGDGEELFARVGRTVHALDPETMTAQWSVGLDPLTSGEGRAAALVAADGVCIAAFDGPNDLVALADP